ncbi:MAG: MotA/TolQ/ExbB proton channel family protein [Phycisphaerales bacterium]
MTRPRWIIGVTLGLAATALAQTTTPQSPAAPVGPWGLFLQSFDFFTIVLLLGSVAAGAYIFRAIVEIRPGAIVPAGRIVQIADLVRAGRIGELRGVVYQDNSFVGATVRAALEQGGSRESMREAAELAASEQIAGWFRRIEPLNVIGNLGPLVGLAGTVWGMILAFTTLGEAGGQASPAHLSLGISKALFHTLLGLCLAIPALLVFGYYRGVIDRHCTRALVIASELVERLPAEEGEPAPAPPAPPHRPR